MTDPKTIELLAWSQDCLTFLMRQDWFDKDKSSAPELVEEINKHLKDNNLNTTRSNCGTTTIQALVYMNAKEKLDKWLGVGVTFATSAILSSLTNTMIEELGRETVLDQGYDPHNNQGFDLPLETISEWLLEKATVGGNCGYILHK